MLGLKVEPKLPARQQAELSPWTQFTSRTPNPAVERKRSLFLLPELPSLPQSHWISVGGGGRDGSLRGYLWPQIVCNTTAHPATSTPSHATSHQYWCGNLSISVHWCQSNLRDTVLGEIGKDSFSALLAKQATASSCPQNYVSQFGEDSEKFYINCLKRA